MNIWLIYQHAIPPSQPGGTRHHYIAKTLIERGHSVTIFSASFDHFTRSETRVHKNKGPMARMEDGVPFLWFRVPKYGESKVRRILCWLDFAFKAWRHGKSGALQKPDLIISSTPPMFTPFAALRLARHFKALFVPEILDIWPDTLVDMTGMSKRHPFILALYWLERHLYRNASLIISVPPRFEQHLAAMGMAECKVQVLRNGVQFDNVKASPLPKESETFTITYAGHHGFANNLEMAVEAAAQLKDSADGAHIRFRFVGDGPYKPVLMERARELGLDNVEFLPVVGRNDIYSELARADAFLMILRNADVFKWGISPNKLSDYMSCARPILFGVSTNDNPVRRANAGIDFAPEDAASLAEAAMRLAATPRSEREGMAAAGRAYAEKHHDLKRNTHALVDRLESLLAQG